MKQFWTKDEMDKLAEMAAQGKTNAQIAAALCRSVGSVAHKRARLFRDAEHYITEGSMSGLFEGTAGAMEDFEDPDGEGTTELERELKYVQELLDTTANAISHNAEILEHNMATVMERVNELSQRQTVLEDEVAELKKRTNLIAENISQINVYLNLGPLYRLFHSFRKFREVRNRG